MERSARGSAGNRLADKQDRTRKIHAVARRCTGDEDYTEPKVVVPGDRIRVALTFTNNAANPAAGVKLVNPIPEGLVFDDTANAGFTVSTDGGNSFGALASLTVPVQGASPRAATAADVTHVRWLWPDAIAPGQSRSVAFFGRVR
jgi:uncharacterized repeat protein (TIGR01451 family)